MNLLEGQAFNRLARHLDGSIILDGQDLYDRDVEFLAHAARVATGGRVEFDEEALIDTLNEVGQRHADGGR